MKTWRSLKVSNKTWMMFNRFNLLGEIWADIVALPSFRRTYSSHFCSWILRLHCNNQVGKYFYLQFRIWQQNINQSDHRCFVAIIWSIWLMFSGGGVSTKSSHGPIPAAFSFQLAYRAMTKGVAHFKREKMHTKNEQKNDINLVFRGRLMRRTIARYLIVALIQCLRMTSIQVWAQ